MSRDRSTVAQFWYHIKPTQDRGVLRSSPTHPIPSIDSVFSTRSPNRVHDNSRCYLQHSIQDESRVRSTRRIKCVRRACALASETGIFRPRDASRTIRARHVLSHLVRAFPQTVKPPCSSHTKPSWLKTCGSPKSHWPTSNLENTVAPHSTCHMLPLADRSSVCVWTPQVLGRILGCI